MVATKGMKGSNWTRHWMSGVNNKEMVMVMDVHAY